MIILNIALLVVSIYLGHEITKRDKVIEEYQKSLLACENETIGDKILDKIGRKHND